jgi:hypothetical protein
MPKHLQVKQLIHQGYTGGKNKFNFVKKISILLFASIVILNIASAQQFNRDTVDVRLQKLIKLKINYEKYKMAAIQDSNELNIIKRDSICNLYKKHVYNIKSSPNIYLKFINNIIRNDSQQHNVKLPYRFIPNSGSYINLSYYEIYKNDFYKVIKYSLFKRKDSILPTEFRGLPVVDEKKYNGYDKNKRIEFKIASKFLFSNLSLTIRQIKFINNCDNQVHTLSMKRYLDTGGVSEENKEFIKWAIDYLIKSPEVTLGYLNNVYDVVRYQNTRPRDKNN